MRKAPYNLSKHGYKAVLGNSPRLYIKHSAFVAQKRLRASFSAANERWLVRVKIRTGQRFLGGGGSFPWLSLPVHHARTWLRDRDVKAVPNTD